MAYNENAKLATMAYIKAKQREIKLRFKREDYEERIEPAIKKSGLPVATFIKEAINEKIVRDGLA